MRIHSLALSLWLAAGCGVARESLGELPEAGSAGRKRPTVLAGRAGSAEADPEPDAGTGRSGDRAAGSGGAPVAGSGGDTAAAGSGGSSPSECEADGCDAAAQPLAAYCDHEHARCPEALGGARSQACSETLQSFGPIGNPGLEQRATLANTCGGTTVRLRFKFGTVEYHYGADQKLRAVTTLTPAAGGPCAATFYRYGDIGCAPTGDAGEIKCEP